MICTRFTTEHLQSQCLSTDGVHVQQIDQAIIGNILAIRSSLEELLPYPVLHVLVFGEELQDARQGV